MKAVEPGILQTIRFFSLNDWRKGKMKYLGFLLLTMMLCSACAVPINVGGEFGRPFDLAAVEQIKKGKTTEAEVISILGEPWRKNINPDGTKCYTYMHTELQKTGGFLGGITPLSKRLFVCFDKDGVVSVLDWGVS